MRNLVIWTDGSCLDQQSNDRKAAARIVVENPNGDETFTYQLGNTTNNIAEITAILKGLEYADTHKARKVEIKTDSRVALAWIKKGPSKSCPDNKKKEIETLRRSINKLCATMEVTLTWVPGETQKADFGFKNSRKKPVSGLEISTLRQIANIARKHIADSAELANAIDKLDRLRDPNDNTNISGSEG